MIVVTRHEVKDGKRPISKATYPVHAEMLPGGDLGDRKYLVSFAETVEQLRSIQKLRFGVFNVELGEGLDESFETGRDEDRFDAYCHHLLVEERSSGEVIGTYRMMTGEMAERRGGFYSADEFDLSRLPGEIPREAVELGRACIAPEHRNRKVLFLLWRGLAAYLAHNHKRYLFGCCSLTSQDPAEGKRVMDHLTANGHVRFDLPVLPMPGWECYSEGQTYEDTDEVHIPRLFKLYLRYGAKVCGSPALDRFFRTIDYFVVFDLMDLDSDLHKLYFD